jgi:Family of unknown function (DUF6152)
MKRIQRTIVSAVAAFLLLPALAMAHHGWSGYETEIRTVSGVIDESSYTSPHGTIRLKTPDKTWVVVLAPPSRMTNRGLTEVMLKVGTNVSVDGYQHLKDENEMRAERISVGGKTVELR